MTFNPKRDAFLRDAKMLLSRADTLINELEPFMEEMHDIDERTTELEFKTRCASLHEECTAWFKNAKEICALLTKRENELITKMDRTLSKYVRNDKSLDESLDNTKWFRGKIKVMIEALEPWTRPQYLHLCLMHSPDHENAGTDSGK